MRVSGNLFSVAGSIFRVVHLVLHLDEPRPKALDLLLNRRTNVERLDDRAKAFASGNCLETGHSRANDKSARWSESPRRSHEHGKKLRKIRRREQRASVARDSRHRA